MSNVSKQYFTTSEFAKMCGVTKHTLFHYDDIGLLTPEFVNAKGYRYYSFRQTYLLDIINVLKKAGTSLQEIKDYLQNQNKPKLVTLLKQKQLELDAELLRIGRMQNLLGNAIHMTETSTETFRSDPFTKEFETEYFITTPLEEGDDKDYTIKLSEHRDYCEKHAIDHEFPIWTITSRNAFMQKEISWGFIANRLNKPIVGERVLPKSKGLYAGMDHKGSYDTVSETCSLLKEYIRSNGMKVSGDAYSMDLLNYFSEKDPESYIIRIMVAVTS